jgi:uncharacterized protein
VVEWSSRHPGIQIRDLDRLAHYLHAAHGGDRDAWEAHRIDPLPTVAHNGNVVLLSPELTGVTDPRYNNFIAGNVLDQSLTAIVAKAWQLRYVQEFAAGLASCRATCAFFDFCRGAQAGNRYFENGAFSTTETNYCRVTRQELVRGVADAMRGRATTLPAFRDVRHTDAIDAGYMARFDNKPTWDNWSKAPAPPKFDNRPTWDNWTKK